MGRRKTDEAMIEVFRAIARIVTNPLLYREKELIGHIEINRLVSDEPFMRDTFNRYLNVAVNLGLIQEFSMNGKPAYSFYNLIPWMMIASYNGDIYVPAKEVKE